jgi:hypothetical protein
VLSVLYVKFSIPGLLHRAELRVRTASALALAYTGAAVARYLVSPRVVRFPRVTVRTVSGSASQIVVRSEVSKRITFSTPNHLDVGDGLYVLWRHAVTAPTSLVNQEAWGHIAHKRLIADPCNWTGALIYFDLTVALWVNSELPQPMTILGNYGIVADALV